MAPPAEHPIAPLLGKARDALRRNHLFDCAIVFWRGTSGHAYVHTIYTLAGCPEVRAASVMLVRNPDNGGRIVLDVICVDLDVPSLNLADIRMRGAQLGANEVHLHFATGNKYARHMAAFDLRTRHGGIKVVGG